MDILDKKTLKLTQLCRLCLSEDGLMVHLFGEESYGHKVPLPERILCSTTVEVKKGDGLPVVICHRCLYYVDTFVEFRHRCKRVDAALHIFSNEIKFEAVSEETVSEVKQHSCPAEAESPDSLPEVSHLAEVPASVDKSLTQENVPEKGEKVNGTDSISESISVDKLSVSEDNAVKQEELVNGTNSTCEPSSDSSDMSAKDARMGPSNKPYHCPHCNKPFTYKARLAAHIKTHGESQVYQGDTMLQTIQQPSLQSIPQQVSPLGLQHSTQQQQMQPQSMQPQSIQTHSLPQQQHLQHQLSPGANPYTAQQHQMQYAMSPQHIQQQQTSVQQQYLSQQSIPHGSPRAASQPLSPLHPMSPQHHSMQQLHHVQQASMQQQATMHQSTMQQQASLQHQIPMQHQPSIQQQLTLQQQGPMQDQAPAQQHGSTQHQAPMQHTQGMHLQSMHQQTIHQQQQQSLQQQQQQQQQHSMQQQIMQQQNLQQSVGQTYDGRMYDMNYMPETPGTPPSSGSDNSYSCSSCSATFMTPWMLADHVRSRCCDPNVSYNCDKCYSQFGSFGDLEQHKLSRSCENQVPSYYDAYTPPPSHSSHYGMYGHQQHQDFSSGGEIMDSRNTPSPWNVMATRSPGSIGNGGSSRPRMQRQDSYATRSPQLGTMEELEKFAMSNTVVTSPLEPLSSPGLTEPLASAPSPLDPENSIQSVQSVQSVQSTHSTQSSGSGSCGPRSSVNFNTSSSVRFGGPNFCGGNVSSSYGTANANPSFMGSSGQSFSNVSQNFGNASPNQNFGSNIMMQNPAFGSNGNCFRDHNSSSNLASSGGTQSLSFVEESNLSFGSSVMSNYIKKSNSGCSSPQDSRHIEVNANTKFCDDMNSCQQDEKNNDLTDNICSPIMGSGENEIKTAGKVDSLMINISDPGSSCAEMLLATSPGSSKGCLGGNNDNSYSCQVCKASFASRTLFTNHMKTHAPDRSVKCNLCSNSFPTNAALRSHFDSVHSESGSEKSLHIVLDDSQSPGKMNENGNSDDSDDEPLSKLVKPALSPVKKRGRKTKAQLEAESENGEKSHECVFCGKGFATAVRLAVHTKLHTTEKPFKCDQCEKAFRSKAHLQRHVKTHAGDKPFKCETCNKSFTVSMNLKIHMRTHTGERPYQCNLCKMAFIGYSHLYNHLKTHSDTQGPFTYTYFNKVYTTTGNFTLTKREKTARGRNKDRDIENDVSKVEGDSERVKDVGRALSKSSTGKKRGRKAHFYEPEPEDDEIIGDEEEEGIATSDEALEYK